MNSLNFTRMLRIHLIISLQEIAWQRLDELQPSSDEVISRGITGLKLYMVSPFLAWVQLHIFDILVMSLVLSMLKKIHCLHADLWNLGFQHTNLIWLQDLICHLKVFPMSMQVLVGCYKHLLFYCLTAYNENKERETNLRKNILNLFYYLWP